MHSISSIYIISNGETRNLTTLEGKLLLIYGIGNIRNKHLRSKSTEIKSWQSINDIVATYEYMYIHKGNWYKQKC